MKAIWNCAIWDSRRLKFVRELASHKKRHTKDDYLLKTLGKGVLVNNVEYLCTAKILSYKFGSFRAEMVKKLVHFHKCKMKKVYVVFTLAIFCFIMELYYKQE